MAKTATSHKKPSAKSKKDQAIKLVARMQARKHPADRQTILAALVEKVGVTKNGAATYYQNIVSGKEGWTGA